MSTTVLTTIPTAATPEAPPTPEAPAETPASEPAVDAAPAETPAPEPPKEDKPDPDLEIAKKFDQVARKEARVRRQEAELQSLKTKLSEELEAAAKLRQELEAAIEDPIGYHIKKGKDPLEIAQRFTKPMTEEEKRLAKIEERLKQDEERQKKWAEEQESKQREAAQQRFWHGFISETKVEEYPYLTSIHEPSDIPDLVMGLLTRPIDPSDPESPTVREQFRARYDRDPTPKEIRDALEAEAESRATSLMERLKPKTATSQVTPETPTANPESPSLSNQHAASSPSARAGNKSREDAMRELRAELEAEA